MTHRFIRIPAYITKTVKFNGITADLYISADDRETFYLSGVDVQGEPLDFEATYIKKAGSDKNGNNILVSFEDFYSEEVFKAVQGHFDDYADYKYQMGEIHA